jgi:chromosome segregation ATPase
VIEVLKDGTEFIGFYRSGKPIGDALIVDENQMAARYETLESERDRLANELDEWQSMAKDHAENSANATSDIIALRAELAATQEESRTMIQAFSRVRTALITCEDRHHPDSEWCAEAKEVMG